MNIKLYNSITEISTRLLILISHSDISLSLDRLIFYDFAMLHFRNIDIKEESLHPDNPMFISELFTKHELINDSISTLVYKGLIEINFSKNLGVQYNKSSFSNDFLCMFESEYFNKLNKNAIKVIEKFNSYTDIEINQYQNDNMVNWSRINSNLVLRS